MTKQVPENLEDFWADTTDPDENSQCDYAFTSIAQCTRRAEWLVRLYGRTYLVCDEHRAAP